MKSIYLIILVCFSCTLSGMAQTSTNTNSGLYALGKVWGFLKYYHPTVAQGNYDWDAEGLKAIEAITPLTTKEAYSAYLMEWIDTFGAIPECAECTSTPDAALFTKNLDLSWLTDEALLTKELSAKLKHILQNRYTAKLAYVALEDYKVTFSASEQEALPYPDEAHRILALYSFWNKVAYFFPYAYLTNTPWDAVLQQQLTVFRQASNATEYQLAIKATVAMLNDGHARFNTPATSAYHGEQVFPAYFQLVENKAIITGFFNKEKALAQDLLLGDEIVLVNKQPIQTLIAANRKYVCAANEASGYMIDNLVTWGQEETVEVQLKRGDRVYTKTVHRIAKSDIVFEEKAVKAPYYLLQDNIGYIAIHKVSGKAFKKDLLEFMQTTDALIIDMRGYSNVMPSRMAGCFIDEETPFAKFLVANLSYPGTYVWEAAKTIKPLKKYHYDKPVFLLVDENDISASETAILCLQAGNHVTTVGRPTSGTDGGMTRVKFGGFNTSFSGFGVYYPNGAQLQRKGVHIDVTVPLTIKDIAAGKDAILEKALELAGNADN